MIRRCYYGHHLCDATPRRVTVGSVDIPVQPRGIDEEVAGCLAGKGGALVISHLALIYNLPMHDLTRDHEGNHPPHSCSRQDVPPTISFHASPTNINSPLRMCSSCVSLCGASIQYRPTSKQPISGWTRQGRTTCAQGIFGRRSGSWRTRRNSSPKKSTSSRGTSPTSPVCKAAVLCGASTAFFTSLVCFCAARGPARPASAKPLCFCRHELTS